MCSSLLSSYVPGSVLFCFRVGPLGRGLQLRVEEGGVPICSVCRRSSPPKVQRLLPVMERSRSLVSVVLQAAVFGEQRSSWLPDVGCYREHLSLPKRRCQNAGAECALLLVRSRLLHPASPDGLSYSPVFTCSSAYVAGGSHQSPFDHSSGQ